MCDTEDAGKDVATLSSKVELTSDKRVESEVCKVRSGDETPSSEIEMVNSNLTTKANAGKEKSVVSKSEWKTGEMAQKTEKVKSSKKTPAKKTVEASMKKKIGKCFRKGGGNAGTKKCNKTKTQKRSGESVCANTKELVHNKKSCTALLEKGTDYGYERNSESMKFDLVPCMHIHANVHVYMQCAFICMMDQCLV